MKPEFWKERWQTGMTGWHRDEVHPDLIAHQDWLLGEGDHRVLVPLCGASLDLDWIRRQGDTAVGIELSEIAVRSLYERAELTPEVTVRGDKRIFRSPGLVVICGNVFDVTLEDVGPVDRIWDRAALVALPGEVRRQYVPQVLSLLRPGGRVLLNTLSYNDCGKSGPPHSVDDLEVSRLYRDCEIEVFERRDLSDEIRPDWRDLGMNRMFSHLSRIVAPA